MESEDKNLNITSDTPLSGLDGGGQGYTLERGLEYCHSLIFSASVPSIPDYIAANRKAEEITLTLTEIRRALAMSSKGDFSYKITSKGFLAGVMKGLQSKLNSLGWMARRIADGDMEQRVDFMGDISEAFNSMTEQLSATLKKLREEEERWKLAMLCSRDGIWEISLDSDAPAYYSDRVLEMIGVSLEDAPNAIGWRKFFHPDDHELLALYQRFIKRTEPPVSFEIDHRLRRKDGSYHWFHTCGMTLFDPITSKPLRIIGVIADIQDRKEREELFFYQATHDALTKLPNRLLFDEHIKNGIATAKRFSSHLAVVMVDLDKFKNINDTLGHQAGDRVLTEVASRMQKNMRESDMVSRFGGDEFAVILSFGKNEWHAVKKVFERTLLALREPILFEDKEITITASFGVSVYPEHGESPKILMARADEALYYAKDFGRNVCVLWERGKRFNVLQSDLE